MYSAKVIPAARRDLDKISGNIFELIVKAIESLEENPRPPGCKKLAAMEGYRVRIRDYRILYRIDDRNRIVCIYRVRHRSQVYR